MAAVFSIRQRQWQRRRRLEARRITGNRLIRITDTSPPPPRLQARQKVQRCQMIRMFGPAAAAATTLIIGMVKKLINPSV